MDRETAAAGRQDARSRGRRCIPYRSFVVIGRVDLSYKDILDRADAFFHEIQRTRPQHLQCSGCSLCCYGLFEISAADIPMLAEGLAKLHPRRRKMIVRRAAEIVRSTGHFDIRGCSESSKDEFFNRTGSIACPNLNDAGQCMVYEHRPLVCRTFGLPLREGGRYIGDICDLNFTSASDAERFASAWDLEWEDWVDPREQYTIPEAIVLIARIRRWA